MMELLINGKRLDLEPEAVFAVTVQSNDITKPDTVQSTYSNSLTAPFTERNHAVLENAGEVTGQSMYPYRRLEATVLADGVEVLPLPKAYLSEAAEGYELQLFSGALDLFEMLGDKSITDLDLSRFDHLWDYDNVLSGCRSYRTYADGYIYTPFHTGKPFTPSSHWAEDVHPSVFVRTVFEQMLTEAGVTYTGIEDVLWDRLILPFSNEKPVHTAQWLEARAVNMDTRLNNTGAIPVTAHGLIKVTLEVDAAFISEDRASSIGVYLRRNGVWLNVQEVQVTSVGITTLEAVFDVQPTMDLQGLEIWTLRTNLSPVGGGTVGDSTYNYYTISCRYDEEVYYNTEWAVGINLPEIKQKDFLKAIRSLFDLMVTFDPYRNELRFTPFNKLEENKAVALDWTNKLVHVDGQRVPVQYRFGEFAQRNWFRYQEDELGASGDAYLVLDDEQLALEKDAVKLPFAASEEESGFLKIPLYRQKDMEEREHDKYTETIATRNNMSGLADGDLVLVKNAMADPDVVRGWAVYEYVVDRGAQPNGWILKQQERYFYDRQKLVPRIGVLSEATTDITLRKTPDYSVVATSRGAAFTPISFEQLLPTRYTSLQGVLEKTKGIRPYFLLSVGEVQGYDPAVPIWLDQYQSYFYLNQITEFTGEGPTECQLWRL